MIAAFFFAPSFVKELLNPWQKEVRSQVQKISALEEVKKLSSPETTPRKRKTIYPRSA